MAAPKQLLRTGQESLKEGGAVYIHTNLALHPMRYSTPLQVLKQALAGNHGDQRPTDIKLQVYKLILTTAFSIF